jgi:hypothetical protein
LDESDIAFGALWRMRVSAVLGVLGAQRAGRETDELAEVAQHVGFIGVAHASRKLGLARMLQCARLSGACQRALQTCNASIVFRTKPDAFAKEPLELALAEPHGFGNVRYRCSATRKNADGGRDACVERAPSRRSVAEEASHQGGALTVAASQRDALGQVSLCGLRELGEGSVEIDEFTRSDVEENAGCARQEAHAEQLRPRWQRHDLGRLHGPDDARLTAREIEEKVDAAVRQHAMLRRRLSREAPKGVDEARG